MKHRKSALAALAAVVIAGAGGATVTALASSGRTVARQDTGLPAATATIESGDLSTSTQEQGTLDFSGQRKLNAGAAGTVTWLPGAGSTVTRDGRLYAVDGTPTRLMYGGTPMYRTLKSGDKGDDVKALEQNLCVLGYAGGLTVDDTYTDATANAVKRWQGDHDLPKTGTVGPDEIAFAPGPLRIASATAAVGDSVAPGVPVLTTTGSHRVVQFPIDVADAASARMGTKVTVELPDGTKAPGTVSSVGSTVQETGGQDKTPQVTVTVTFDHPSKVGGFDKSPVTVDLPGETHKDVLTVPVNALLAMPSGGYGIQVVQGGKARDIPARLGIFAQGRVEVSGPGLREGMKVGVSSS
ncbi:peptidoglycan-binding protein [Actinacidiphila oryziradicis]|uniref:Efflux RND transporter periplasmic adaptor subunit n=1 Tax=Actinacidiphila oryziradicis TaxID=2571141 RepID=A0A4U0S539_9ACTN|nr:peptidoglycan-binding protein [Actinacidiphila oryziradicis]TKA02171.1 efflux RND transporter periplasmic adaptor subunit [Actinacidiphila oryziradicis]